MDPNQTLKELRELVQNMLAKEVNSTSIGSRVGARLNDATDLAEKIEALDLWLSSGGFLPQDWQPKPASYSEPADDL